LSEAGSNTVLLEKRATYNEGEHNQRERNQPTVRSRERGEPAHHPVWSRLGPINFGPYTAGDPAPAKQPYKSTSNLAHI
jgi:hypothetical protein